MERARKDNARGVVLAVVSHRVTVDCRKPGTITAGDESCCAPNHERVIRERAWTSPMRYEP